LGGGGGRNQNILLLLKLSYKNSLHATICKWFTPTEIIVTSARCYYLPITI